MPRLAADLAQLKTGRAVTNPVTGALHAPASTNLFEAPLGYAHEATGRHIDFLVFIDTPPEVALARWLMSRLPETGNGPAVLNGQPLPVRHLLQLYLTQLRPLYQVQRSRVRAEADLVLDGEQPVDVLAARVLATIQSD
jgi:hypothetical protein